jgi:hypothetical protein
MKIIFTICSNNYLAQAKALGDSILETNPDYQFFIGLVDTLSPEINYDTEIGHPIILSKELGITDFDSLWKKYNIIELNTCLKPFYLKYFTKNNSDLTHLMYFDPDTLVFGNLEDIENELTVNKEIILTPHILNPIPLDDKLPSESIFLNYGLYNLGFIGIKNPKNNLSFFEWWGERTYKIGYDKVAQGLFVDQLWMNLTPLFFDNTVISKNLGLNMAPWNLHERIITKSQNKILTVNNKNKLIFYHFSNYKFNNPEILATYYNRFSFDNRKDLVDLYDEYRELLLKNNIEKLSVLNCYYVELRNNLLKEEDQKKQNECYIRSLKNKIKDKLISFLK